MTDTQPTPTPLAPPAHVAAGELIESSWGNQVVDELTRLGLKFGYVAQFGPSTFTNTAKIPWVSAGTNLGGWVIGADTAVPANGEGVYGITVRVNYSAAPPGVPAYISLTAAGETFSTIHTGAAGALLTATVPLFAAQTLSVTVNPGGSMANSTALMYCWRIAPF